MSQMNNAVRLEVNGSDYGGWKSVRIEAGIERQARSFDLAVTDRWPGATDVPRRIKPGDACQVYIGADLVLTGYVDATPIKYDGRSITVATRGRSKTADLVDCCPVQSSSTAGSSAAESWADVKGPAGTKAAKVQPPAQSASQWRNQKLERIAAALAAPYNVQVYAEVDTGKPIAEHSIQVGETVFESIDRMLRLRHVLSTDTALGQLVFIEVASGGHASTAIELGVNVLSADATLDYTGVFSDYIVKGQRAGSDSAFGSAVSEEEGESTPEDDAGAPQLDGSSGTARDNMALRRRVLVLKQSGQADEGTVQDRADYERAHRKAKALQTTYTVAGWRQDDGALWVPNQLAAVRDEKVGFSVDMLIAEVAYILDDQGMRCELKVGPPDGYRTKAGKLKASKRQKGGGAAWSDVK